MAVKRIVVVGGGPAGMMAAIRASSLGQDVTLVEKNASLGRKLLLSGKGRCNLTNACDLDSFLKRFSHTGAFLRDAFKKFFNQELMQFFEKRGVKLKIERQQRVFPVVDRSDSILKVLEKELHTLCVNILYKARMKDILLHPNLKGVKGLILEGGKLILADRIILATGGISYSFTGSTGEGIDLAKRLGHSTTPLRPGLVALEVRQKYPKALQGLTLKNIRLKFSDGRRQIVSDIGELLFTDSGISGPLVLTLSGQICDWLAQGQSVFVEIDLKPALSREQLHARLLRDFKQNSKKSIKNTLKELLPQKCGKLFMEILRIDPHRPSAQTTRSERDALISLLKGFKMNILKAAPLEQAMVTRGGVSLREINPRTMESRRIKGLYFCGEMIDIDADTGGFNLQAAFSTGYLAGESASLS
ncbi:MAG: NAD(P)/FAD-dependent oxidoreductase [Candidatus Omnitrophota bacterium]